jgi:hypothetical protein
VTHPLHQLAEIHTRASRQHVASVTEIMKVNLGQVNLGERLQPDPAAEVGVPQRTPARAREQQAVASSSGSRAKPPIGVAVSSWRFVLGVQRRAFRAQSLLHRLSTNDL